MMNALKLLEDHAQFLYESISRISDNSDIGSQAHRVLKEAGLNAIVLKRQIELARLYELDIQRQK